MSRKAEQLCSALGFYGLSASQDAIRRFIEVLQEWFDDQKCPITQMALDGPSWSGKPGKHQAIRRRLRDEPNVEISGVSAFSVLPGPTDLMMNSKLQAEFSFLDLDRSWGMIEARPLIADVPGSEAMRITKEIVRLLNPKYGIGLRRNLSEGPGCFVMGIPFRSSESPLDTEELARTQAWRRIGMRKCVYNHGLLRGLYPWNIVNSSHLNFEIEGDKLGEWVERKSERGSLTRLDSRLHLWEVTDEAIPHVLSTLERAGMIFSELREG